MIVLQYIANTTRRFCTFVANRVASIYEASDPSQWVYVPSEDNPADDASRGLPAEKVSQTRWSRGPELLWRAESTWQEDSSVTVDLPADDQEVKVEAKSCLASTQMPVGGRTLDDLIMHYSSLNRILRAVVWLSKLKDRLRKRKGVQRELAADDIEASEEFVVRYV